MWYFSRLALLAVFVFASVAVPVFATESTSNNYQVTETQLGAGGMMESCSVQYCAQASIGDIAAGSGVAGPSTAAFGPLVSGEPLLEVIVDAGQSNLGVLTTEQTATKTTTVRVRNYLSGGYIMQVIGDPPKYGNHTLATPSTPAASSPGTEQFAINAVANTTPNVGAGPQQVPSDQTSFGEVVEGYLTANRFKYSSGDIVARSQSESGRTDYTISMIVNVSNATPAGHYSGDFSVVVVPVY